jgi:MFS family permease
MHVHLVFLHVTSTETLPVSAVLTTTTTPVPPVPAAEQRWTPRLWGILAVLCAVLFLDGLDVSMVGVALPSIGTDLHLSTTSLQWIVNGYVLGYGGLLLLGGRTADLLGRRNTFLIALAVFAVASLAGGLIDDGTLLIVTRFVKGLAAAFTAPTALSILTTTFHQGRARNRALSVFSVFGASGYSSGLILGGLLTSFGWRWTFLIPVPLAAAALVAGIALIPRDRRPAGGGHDILGAVTLTSGMLLAVYTVVSAPQRGWLDPVTVGSLVLAAALLVAFVLTENRVAHPLIRLSILRVGAILRANLSIIALFGSYLSYQFMMTLYLQDVLLVAAEDGARPTAGRPCRGVRFAVRGAPDRQVGVAAAHRRLDDLPQPRVRVVPVDGRRHPALPGHGAADHAPARRRVRLRVQFHDGPGNVRHRRLRARAGLGPGADLRPGRRRAGTGTGHRPCRR